MKKFLLDAAKTGVPFGVAMGLVAAASGDNAVVLGAAQGIAFGCLMAGFMALYEKRAAKVVAELAPEGIVHHGPATHMATGRIGGWLVLTEQRLVFVPHKLNVGGKRQELAVADVAGARPGDALLPNQIEVVTRAGQRLRFVVKKRRDWLAKLPGVKPAA